MSMTKRSPGYEWLHLTDCDDCHRVNNECVCGEDEPEGPVEPAYFKTLPLPNYAGLANVTIGSDYENLQRR